MVSFLLSKGIKTTTSNADSNKISAMLQTWVCSLNRGSATADAAVAAIHTNVSRFICSSFSNCVSEGRFALSYCLPSFKSSNQKMRYLSHKKEET